MENVIKSVKIGPFDLAASGNFTSQALSLNEMGTTGSISIQYILTGTGTAKIEWLESSDGDEAQPQSAINFVRSSDGYSLATGLTVTSGTDSNGKDKLDLFAGPSKFLKLYAEETGTSNSVTMTLIVTTN